MEAKKKVIGVGRLKRKLREALAGRGEQAERIDDGRTDYKFIKKYISRRVPTEEEGLPFRFTSDLGLSCEPSGASRRACARATNHGGGGRGEARRRRGRNGKGAKGGEGMG